MACGSSKDDAGTASTEGQALTATTPSTTPATTVPTAASMRPLLLTTAEVGPGWTASAPSDTSADSLPSCLKGLTSISPDRPGAEQEWEQPSGAFFDESMEFAGADTISSEFAAATALFDGCKDLTLDVQGVTLTGTIAPVPLTAGDQSAGYELTFTANGITLVMDLGIVAVNGYELSTGVGSVGAADHATFADLTAKAVAKIEAGGGQTA